VVPRAPPAAARIAVAAEETRIDRLARSLRNLQNIVPNLRQRGVALKATEQPIDTSTAAGKCFLDMWACSANSKPIYDVSARWRALRGRKANGVYAGKERPSSINAAQVRTMKASGMGATKIAKALASAGRASIGRWRRVNEGVCATSAPAPDGIGRHRGQQRLVAISAGDWTQPASRRGKALRGLAAVAFSTRSKKEKLRTQPLLADVYPNSRKIPLHPWTILETGTIDRVDAGSRRRDIEMSA
jgi:Resolvase, N terminal domain